MASVTYGKSIMSSVIMAKILWQMKLSLINVEPNMFLGRLMLSLICSMEDKYRAQYVPRKINVEPNMFYER